MTDQTFYISDLHLQHRRVADLRGFGEDVDAHDAKLAKQWDRYVGGNDTVWVLGDLTISKLDYSLGWIADRPGTKILIAGNHDACHPMHRGWRKQQRRYEEVFDLVMPFGAIRLEGHTVQVSHFPRLADHTDVPRYPEWRFPPSNLWLIHGHTHSSERVDLAAREIHVGVDAWGMTPVTQGEIAKIIRENP
jgi:calcineurin-like phosphoesterase family protein